MVLFQQLGCAGLAILAGSGLVLSAVPAAASDTNTAFQSRLLAHSQKKFLAAQELHAAQPTNTMAGWQLARAAFDRAEYATNDTERAALAVQGIGVCRTILARASNCAPAHYYLGLNLGQLARTRLLGALPLVSDMEEEFKAAIALDEQFDYAGPDRFLGQLYYQAPGWPASVGSQRKARKHMERAVEFAPDYPENRLNLAEAYLKWREKKLWPRELEALEALWPAARTNFTGADWAAAWSDWQPRFDKLRAHDRP